MAKRPDRKELKEWADKADLTNLAPHRERVAMWEELKKVTSEVASPERRYKLTRKNFNAFKNYLTAYQSKVADNDAVAMAFNKSLDEVLEELDEDADDDLDDIKSELSEAEHDERERSRNRVNRSRGAGGLERKGRKSSPDAFSDKKDDKPSKSEDMEDDPVLKK